MERARFLVTPGPTEISTRVLRAYTQQSTHNEVIRLAHMSVTSHPMYVLRTIQALGSTLRELGLSPNIGNALRSAQDAFRVG